ncbi:MAG: UvrD-helicase domain-containing protein, partial [Lachnospiraceae bacterium]|nr:UvrD-helicase domain-containing protein [Lachnospiraceae bacterium]
MIVNGSLDEEQQRKEIVSAFDKNMFVEAGAGAGKTTLIVSRIIGQLGAGYNPGEIVVITFTKAAAEELRVRISEKLAEKSKTDPVYKEALDHLDEMNISTIHSFCNVLLKEQAMQLGLPTDIKMLDDTEHEEIKRKLFRDYIKTLNKSDWDNLEKEADENSERWKVRASLYEVYSHLSELPKSVQVTCPKDPDLIKKIEKEIVEVAEDLEEELIAQANGLCVRDIYTLEDLLEEEKICSTSVNAFIKEYRKPEGEDRVYGLINVLRNDVLFKGSNLAKKEYNNTSPKEENECLKKTTQGIKAKINMLPDPDSGEDYKKTIKKALKKDIYYGTIVKYAQEAAGYYRKNKPKDRLSNDELLELTKDLI